MGWILQWVLPKDIYHIDDINRKDIERSIQKLESFTIAHLEQIEKIFIWVSQRHPFSIRQQIEFEERWETYLASKLQKKVEIVPIVRKGENNFDDDLIEVERRMHWLSIQEPFGKIMLFSQPNYPSLQQVVLIKGIKTFADRFCLILQDQVTGEFVHQQFYDSPYRKSWLQLFQHLIHDYNYAGALKLIEGLEKNHRIQCIKLLLEVQQLRENFSFEEAYEKFQEAKSVHKSSNMKMLQTEIILQLLNGERGEQRKELEHIQEIYRHIKALLLKEDYPSFLTRFYRAREAVLNYIVKYGTDEEIHIRKTSSIYQFIDEIEALYEEGKISRYFGVYFYIKSSNVANALQVRNKSFIGHNRKSISRNAIFREYYGSKNIKIPQGTERFLADTRIMLRDLGGSLDDNLEMMNTYLIELMMSAAREGAVKVD